jgi:hypothetical protein
MTKKIKDLFTKAIYNVYRCPNETLDAIEELRGLVDDLIDENNILNLMTKTSDKATGIINDQNLHKLLLKFYDLFTRHFPPEDDFKIDVDFDPEDEINEDMIAITVLTKSDDVEGYLAKYFIVYTELDRARKLLAPECKHVGFGIQYTE